MSSSRADQAAPPTADFATARRGYDRFAVDSFVATAQRQLGDRNIRNCSRSGRRTIASASS